MPNFMTIIVVKLGMTMYVNISLLLHEG